MCCALAPVSGFGYLLIVLDSCEGAALTRSISTGVFTFHEPAFEGGIVGVPRKRTGISKKQCLTPFPSSVSSACLSMKTRVEREKKLAKQAEQIKRLLLKSQQQTPFLPQPVFVSSRAKSVTCLALMGDLPAPK